MTWDMANTYLKEMARERKREESVSSVSLSHCLIKWIINVIKKIIYWYIITYIKPSIPHETVRQWDTWDTFVKTFPTAIDSPTSWILQHFPPLLKRIIQLHDNAVSRDKILIGTPDIVSGLIDNAWNRRMRANAYWRDRNQWFTVSKTPT